MRIDQIGNAHPTEPDPVDANGLRHINECDECRVTFPGTVAAMSGAGRG